jgi:hypothetical protein
LLAEEDFASLTHLPACTATDAPIQPCSTQELGPADGHRRSMDRPPRA